MSGHRLVLWHPITATEKECRMPCPHCVGTTTTALPRKTSLGYRIFHCAACRRIFNERTGTPSTTSNILPILSC